MTKFSTIKLIYASKLKSNVIGRKIMKKIHHLTRNCGQNGLIYFLIKAFDSAFSKAKIWSSSGEFFFFP